MREGLDAPTLEVPTETRENIRAFLDGRSLPRPLKAVLDAAHEAGIAHSGGSLVRLIDLPPDGSVLYDAEANS
jgi:hypothetical protein